MSKVNYYWKINNGKPFTHLGVNTVIGDNDTLYLFEEKHNSKSAIIVNGSLNVDGDLPFKFTNGRNIPKKYRDQFNGWLGRKMFMKHIEGGK